MDSANSDTDASTFLRERGLNLYAVVSVDALDAPTRATFDRAGASLDGGQRLVVFGSGGRALWSALRARGVHPQAGAGTHPIDDYCTAVASEFIDRFVKPSGARILYPSSLAVPLIALGEYVRWSAPSALGMGINTEHGLWFAYRALIVTDAPLDTTRIPANVDPASLCLACGETYGAMSAPTPCVASCPSNAVSKVGDFDLAACVDYRLDDASPCELECSARRACPVGEANAYSGEQLNYHMALSMPALRSWRHGG